jgi:hypothetical protein
VRGAAWGDVTWQFTAVPDKPPTIALAEEPEGQVRGALRLSYKLEDDYGVVNAQALFKLLSSEETNGHPPRPLYSAPDFPLVLPQARTKNGVGQTTKDLTEHPWAGIGAVLAINAVMFVVEIGAGLAAGSAALQADALDFLGDAANYVISLFVVGMALRYRAIAALAKGATMGLFGLWVIATILWHALHGTLPSALTMGAVGFTALAANAASFGLLWAYRGGDANMRSAWICTRNDVLGNLAVLLAAAGVFGTGTGWPDITVAAIMAGLALQGAWTVVRHSLGELRQPLAISA